MTSLMTTKRSKLFQRLLPLQLAWGVRESWEEAVGRLLQLQLEWGVRESWEEAVGSCRFFLQLKIFTG